MKGKKVIAGILLAGILAVTLAGCKNTDNTKEENEKARIPPTSTVLKTASINCNFTVEPQTFTTDLTVHLRSL